MTSTLFCTLPSDWATDTSREGYGDAVTYTNRVKARFDELIANLPIYREGDVIMIDVAERDSVEMDQIDAAIESANQYAMEQAENDTQV